MSRRHGRTAYRSRGKTVVICVLMMMFFAAMCCISASCGSENGAEARVREDLYLLQTSASAGNQLTEIRELGSKDSGADFDAFLENVRGFSFEILGSEELERTGTVSTGSSDNGGSDAGAGDEGSKAGSESGSAKKYMVVKVRIRTYDFGREYLAAWADYLEANDTGDAAEAEKADPDETDSDETYSDKTDPDETASVDADSDEAMRGFYDVLFSRLAGVSDRVYVQDVSIIAIDPLDSGEWITNISNNEELQDALLGGMISEMRVLAGE